MMETMETSGATGECFRAEPNNKVQPARSLETMALNETDINTNFHVKLEFETSDDDFFISKIESLNKEVCLKEEFVTVKETIKEEPVDYELETDQPSEYNCSVTKCPLSESIETTKYEDNRADSCNTLNKINLESQTNEFPCKKSEKKLTKAKINKHTFECTSCNKKFTTEGFLKKHVNHHCHQERPYICVVCDKRYHRNSVLIMHMRTHTGERPFPCNECEKSFSRKSYLTIHKKYHTELRPFHCDLCDRKFRIKTDLIMHMLVHSEKQHACSMCDKKYYRKYALIGHLKTHTGEKPFGCDLCQEKFTSKRNLDQHKKTHMETLTEHKMKRTTIDTKTHHPVDFESSVVQAHTTSGTALRENIPMRSKETMADNEIKNNTDCYIKQEFIPFDKGCNLIKIEPITSEEVYVTDKNECLTSDGDFVNVKKELLKEESAVTAVESGWPVQKPMEYNSASDSLLSENLCCTETTDTFRCDVCCKQFTSKINLRRHIVIHSEHRSSFICEVCKRIFMKRQYIVRHMRIHTGERPYYACSMCSKKFRQKCDLTKHIRTHTKPFSCHMCDKKFSLKYNLQMHSRIHTGERPYACDKCEKTFITKSKMNKHKKTHTKEKPFT